VQSIANNSLPTADPFVGTAPVILNRPGNPGGYLV
jgi:hypothetical protein